MLLDVSPHNHPKRTIGGKNASFHTFTKIGDKDCKVIVNIESWINAILLWIDSTTLEIKQ